eukprot:g68368.t1
MASRNPSFYHQVVYEIFYGHCAMMRKAYGRGRKRARAAPRTEGAGVSCVEDDRSGRRETGLNINQCLPVELLELVFAAVAALEGDGRTLVLALPAVCGLWRRVLQGKGCQLQLSLRFAYTDRSKTGRLAAQTPRDTSTVQCEHNPLTDEILTHRVLPRFGGVIGLFLYGCSAHPQPATQSPIGGGVEWMPMSSHMQS